MCPWRTLRIEVDWEHLEDQPSGKVEEGAVNASQAATIDLSKTLQDREIPRAVRAVAAM
jgi:hypothetical protein